MAKKGRRTLLSLLIGLSLFGCTRFEQKFVIPEYMKRMGATTDEDGLLWIVYDTNKDDGQVADLAYIYENLGNVDVWTIGDLVEIRYDKNGNGKCEPNEAIWKRNMKEVKCRKYDN